jgi:hypothetical protein
MHLIDTAGSESGRTKCGGRRSVDNANDAVRADGVSIKP